MMVGSIVTTVAEGEHVARGQEFGCVSSPFLSYTVLMYAFVRYFAFGGSTIVILFEKGKVTWDDDLLANGESTLETLVRVGMGVGVATV
jgi:phosphatidylserine decarboxylase